MRVVGEAEAVGGLGPEDCLDAAAAALVDAAAAGAPPTIRMAAGRTAASARIGALPAAGLLGVLAGGDGPRASGRALAVVHADGGIGAVVAADGLARLAAAGTTAAAARHLARPGARVAAVLGSGAHAHAQARCLAAALPLERLAVHSPDRAHRTALADRLADDLPGVRVAAAASGQEATAGAHVVVAATDARDPVLRDDWLAPGALVVSAGAVAPGHRELDYRTLVRAAFVCVDDPEEARRSATDLVECVEEGHLEWLEVHGLREVLLGEVDARGDPDDVIVLEVVGHLGVLLELARRRLAAG